MLRQKSALNPKSAAQWSSQNLTGGRGGGCCDRLLSYIHVHLHLTQERVSFSVKHKDVEAKVSYFYSVK